MIISKEKKKKAFWFLFTKFVASYWMRIKKRRISVVLEVVQLLLDCSAYVSPILFSELIHSSLQHLAILQQMVRKKSF